MFARSSRRGFLRYVAGLFSLLTTRAASAQRGTDAGRKSERSVRDVHRATRNTRLGALGEKVPRLERPPPDAKPYPDRERVALPAIGAPAGGELAAVVRGWGPAEGFGGESISIEALARVLHHTNGVTRTLESEGTIRHLRAAPSAGALYSGEIYLAARRIDGLQPGLYAYAVKEHALVVLRRGSPIGEVAAALSEPAGIAGAAGVVLQSNVFGRYTWRYAGRGYRYALIDTGHIAENLRLASAAAGLGCIDLPEFEDTRLAAMLGIDGMGEAVCAVQALGVVSDRARAPAGTPVHPLIERQSVAPPSRGGAWERYHAATALVRGEASAASPSPSADPPPWPAGRGSEPLVSGTAPPASVEAAIRIRRSATQFLADPLEASDLGFVLEMAAGHEALQREPGISLLLVANRVAGIAPGLHRYDGRTQELIAQRRIDLSNELHRACLRQEPARQAAVAIALVADLGPGAVHARHRTYRDLLVEAGAIAQRVYLAAEAAGVAARNLAAFVDDDLNRLLRIDGERRAVVHLTMVGPGD